MVPCFRFLEVIFFLAIVSPTRKYVLLLPLTLDSKQLQHYSSWTGDVHFFLAIDR